MRHQGPITNRITSKLPLQNPPGNFLPEESIKIQSTPDDLLAKGKYAEVEELSQALNTNSKDNSARVGSV
jgi:hypothetical protein